MGQVERASEFTLSFWFSLDNLEFNKVYPHKKMNGEVGRSGKVTLVRVTNPRKPMVASKRGDLTHSSFDPCPVSKTELIKNPSFFELASVRNNPNCFTNGLEFIAKHHASKKSAKGAETNPNGQETRILQEVPKPDSKNSPFTTQSPSNEGKGVLLQSTKSTGKEYDDHMDTIIDISVVFKNFETRENRKVGVYEFVVSFPNLKDSSGKVHLKGQTFDDLAVPENNKFFLGLSLDFKGNKGSLYFKAFDDFNKNTTRETLTMSTEGKLFVNRGFQLVTGDAGNPEATVHFQDGNGQVIKYHPRKQLSKKSRVFQPFFSKINNCIKRFY